MQVRNSSHSRGEVIVDSLSRIYPPIKTPLQHSTPFQLLIATILSAQTTDVQVNRISSALFSRYPDAASMSKASISTLEKIVHSTGFFHVKAQRIREVSRTIMKEFGGNVPETMVGLLRFPGVGRKTANMVLSAGFDRIEGIAVDTHVRRLSQRLGLSSSSDPEKIEQDLMNIIPMELWPKISILLILHGRSICYARAPDCFRCVLSSTCKYFRENKEKMNRSHVS